MSIIRFAKNSSRNEADDMNETGFISVDLLEHPKIVDGLFSELMSIPWHLLWRGTGIAWWYGIKD